MDCGRGQIYRRASDRQGMQTERVTAVFDDRDEGGLPRSRRLTALVDYWFCDPPALACVIAPRDR